MSRIKIVQDVKEKDQYVFCKKWILNHSAPPKGHLDTSLGAL